MSSSKIRACQDSGAPRGGRGAHAGETLEPRTNAFSNTFAFYFTFVLGTMSFGVYQHRLLISYTDSRSTKAAIPISSNTVSDVPTKRLEVATFSQQAVNQV